MGDGELDEGNIWEAAMFAGKYKLGHLVGIVDRNNIQIDGTTEDVMPLDSLRAKWEAFGWHVIEVLEHRALKQLSFEEAEDRVSTKLQMFYVDEEIKKLKKKYIINVDQEALSNLGGMQITEAQD